MNSRRDTLKALAVITAAAPAVQGQQHRHDSESTSSAVKPAANAKPQFFDEEEFRQLTAIADLIIPRTDTPGAADAGVPMLIDEGVMRNRKLAKPWRDGLAVLNSETKKRFSKSFLDLPQAQQVDVLTAASKAAETPAGRFFTLAKNATIDAYYSTREGLVTEIGWNANTFLPAFKGCTHPEHQA